MTPSPAPQALADALLAERRVCLLEGPEGQGKSHFLGLLAASVGGEGAPLISIKCRPEGTLAQLLSEVTGVDPAPPAQLVAALLERPPLATLEPGQRRQAAELLASLVGPATPEFVTASLDSASRREGAFTELTRCLAQRGDGGLRVVAIDDAHRADDETTDFFDFLAKLDGLPVRVVLTADSAPEHATLRFLNHRARWLEQKQVLLARLSPLADQAIAAVLEQQGCESAEAGQLAAGAKGNPGLALGVWRFLQRTPGAAPPLTHDALRVAALKARGEAVWGVAQGASVLGERFLSRALEAMGGAPPFEAAQLVVRDPDGPFGATLGFDDSKVRRAVLATVPGLQVEAWRKTAGTWASSKLRDLVGHFEQAADQLLPLALHVVEGPEASLWREAWAHSLAARGEASASLDALTAAAQPAQGVRRAVLLRRIAEAQLFAGQPEKALATLSPIGRAPLAASPLAPVGAGEVVAGQQRGLLDRWEALGSDDALALIDLTRAEALSHLVRKEDTLRAFGDLERRLERGEGAVAAQLWVRWAKSWSWFLCEILGRPADALKACEKVRSRVPVEVLGSDPEVLGFVRAEEIACSGLGDFARALALAEEMTALATERNDLSGQCLAWNARAILHLGQGEPAASERGFERSLELARTIGWRRREAIATHNVALVQLELGDWDGAEASEERYAVLSVAVGNHAATAEAPLVLAGVALARGELLKADGFVAQARKASEGNGWTMLLAWSRALAGRLRLQRYLAGRDSLELSKARNDFMAALDLFEENSTAWTEEVDPAEVYALHAAALRLAGQPDAAVKALARGANKVPAQNLVSQRALAVGNAFVSGQGIEAALEWFLSRGYQRLPGLWRQLAL